MPLLFEPIYTEGLAQISYLVGDTKAGLAAVIDPRRDVQIYIDMARARGVSIIYALETHIHADFVSGVHELKARTGGAIVGGKADGYQFELDQWAGGEMLKLGSVRLQGLHTPGHTPEHMSYLIFDSEQGDDSFGVFTGDTLFNLDVGRPDLLGHGSEHALALQLHDSLFDKLIPLGDRMEIYPCHGAGSACGKSIGDRRQSTIGNERRFSPALKPRSSEAFADWLLKDMPEPPRHYARLKMVNAAGAPLTGFAPSPTPLTPAAFQARAKTAFVVDVRSILAFGGGHVPGALNIALRDEFPSWAGWVVPPDQDILLIGENVQDVSLAALQLYRIGLDRVVGYLHNGMTDWQNAGMSLQSTQEWTVQTLNARRAEPDVLVLDVRGDDEYAKGHVEGAKHIFVAHLGDHLDALDRAKTIVCYCGSGYRASIAASLLQAAGFERVANVPGSWMAWKAAGLPIVA
ncbi:MAG: MBL fold metallo-hydrolase [Caulobacteraceae bacterium]